MDLDLQDASQGLRSGAAYVELDRQAAPGAEDSGLLCPASFLAPHSIDLVSKLGKRMSMAGEKP
jgi:hypothetical protein